MKKFGMLGLAGQDRGFQGDAKIITNQSQALRVWTNSHKCQSRPTKQGRRRLWLFQFAVKAVKTRSGFTNGIQLTRVRWQRQRHVGCTCDQSPR